MKTKSATLNFEQIALHDRELYTSFKEKSVARGCEYNFVNLFLWGKQHMTVVENCVVVFSQFGNYTTYLYPIGDGNKKAALEAIIADCKHRGVPYRISGMVEDEKDFLEQLYPDMFSYKLNRNGQDYVYSIDDLADLKGKKYQSKRNHYNRFKILFPNYRVEVLDENNISLVKEFADKWYENKSRNNPDTNYNSERSALEKALLHYKELGLEGLALFNEDELLAFTMASRLSENTFDVHFEKSMSDIHGAYAAINCEFAKYIRNKYPEIRFLDREEDMGIEGLRKAKLSYKPHHMVEKYNAFIAED